jgi:hypothetical protein
MQLVIILIGLYLCWRLGRLAYRLYRKRPDLDIGPGYMHRYYVLPRNRFANVYLHCMYKDDDDRALHDHPWHSVSWCLKGRLYEISKGNMPGVDAIGIIRPSFLPRVRAASFAHRLEVPEPSVTLFCTGPVVREWGFHCPKGWVPWRQFVDSRDSGKVGRGCGEHED